jgi:chemotaxis signal transduction protein
MLQECFVVQLTQAIRIGLPLAAIETIVRLAPRELCLIPGMASYWQGVVNHQGKLTWVLDGNGLLELVSPQPLTQASFTAIILQQIIDGTLRRVAFGVNSLDGVTLLDMALTTDLEGPLQKYQFLFSGVVATRSSPIAILDMPSFFQTLHDRQPLPLPT